jgi:peptidoglycan hydrolase-like protein with peptidoglycan-binding domain
MAMANPGQPTIGPGATGDAVRRLQRALRRTANLSVAVDGIFGPVTETAVKEFQQGAGLTVDGIVGDQTWSVPLHAAGATRESTVGLQYVVD